MSKSFQLTADLYHEVYQAAPDAILIVSGDGRIRAANPKVSELFGYAPGELEGQNVEVLIPESHRSAHVSHRNGYRSQPRSRAMGLGMELRGRKKDGSEFPVEVALSPFDADEEDCGQDCVIAIIRDVTERARTRALTAARIQASEAERRRIAQDLHDDTAQRLAALLLQLRLAGRTPGGLDPAVLQSLRDQIEEISDGVRRVARGLRPPELDDVGLGPALRTWVRTVAETRELTIRLETEPVESRLSAEEQLMLYRIIQEAITNVVRHSGAADAVVAVRADRYRITASVTDDGCGFDAKRVLREGTRLGLPGMLERAATIGAHVQIESRAGEGTSVTVSLPCNEEDLATEQGR